MSGDKIFISIITPVYNAEKFIERCIENVQRQNCENYEHLIIDGQSTDNTSAIVKKYAFNDPRIKIISGKDKGVYDAMNKGIQLSQGDWIFFLGSDDFFYSDSVLSFMNKVLLKSSASIVYGNVWNEKLSKKYDGFFGIEKLLKHNICHQSIFFRKEVFNTIGLYNLNYKQEADYDFNLRCWISGISSEYIDEIIAFYSKGGLSSFARDADIVKDYPKNVARYVFESKRTFFNKINILSKIFRKIILRYSFNDFCMIFFGMNNYIIKILALVWMILTFPVFFLSSIIFVKR